MLMTIDQDHIASGTEQFPTPEATQHLAPAALDPGQDMDPGDDEDEEDLYNDPLHGPGCQYLDNNQGEGHDTDDDFGNMPALELEEDGPSRVGSSQVDPEVDPEVDSHKKKIEDLAREAKLNNIKIAMEFIQAIESASLDGEFSKLNPKTLEQLRTP